MLFSIMEYFVMICSTEIQQEYGHVQIFKSVAHNVTYFSMCFVLKHLISNIFFIRYSIISVVSGSAQFVWHSKKYDIVPNLETKEDLIKITQVVAASTFSHAQVMSGNPTETAETLWPCGWGGLGWCAARVLFEWGLSCRYLDILQPG